MLARAVSPAEYAAAAARVAPRRRAYLSPDAFIPEVLRLLGADCYLSACGRAGFYIVAGDLRGLFAAEDAPAGLGRALAAEAPALGARSLDCFAGFLPALYARLGWVEIGRAAWNPALAPPDWNPEDGAPDVVFMERPE